jgi:hypothetical protein
MLSKTLKVLKNIFVRMLRVLALVGKTVKIKEKKWLKVMQ